ncbi:MAG: ABC transporter ATP-binding protein [Chloroflexota bacterium]
MTAAVIEVPAIRLEGFAKSYGAIPAVRGIDLEVRPGEVFGFLGPNGAGKSTTIRCLLDLIRPTAGVVRVLGRDPRREGVEVRRQVGYVPGELRLPDRSSARQLLRSVGGLRGVGLHDRGAQLAERLGLDLDRRIQDLSTGNRRKVALLIAFASRPSLLVLDEPTNGLDPLMQHTFLELVAEARDAGTTVFLSSHVLSEVQRAADRVAVLRAGRIVAQGTVAELRGRARQRLEAWFGEAVPTAELEGVPGLVDPLVDGRRLAATIAGPVGPVLAFLARHDVDSVAIAEPDLEDAFLDLYAEAP